MKSSEAQLFLALKEGESLEEAYEQKLFEWKNFFVHRFPIPRLFNKKLTQLKRLEEAYIALGGLSSKPSQDLDLSTDYDLALKQSFQQFQADRNQLKLRLYAVNSASELIQVVEGLLQITKSYASCWTDASLDLSGVVVSKEVDPMDLLSAINNAEKEGVRTISEIRKLSEGNMVLNEAKRLSLWSKMEENEQG
ncbi:MAG: hypothetical protein Crog4KO_32470 [Crocinitomicaceae bacterium]